MIVWEPPHRIVLSWHPGGPESDATEVELRFSADEAGTRLDMTHRYFERRGDAAAAARGSYDTGWDRVLARYTAATAGESSR